MKLISLQLENFLSFDKLYYDYSAQGLTSLDGPPGVGKSSFLDGISYALFGMISKSSLQPTQFTGRKTAVIFARNLRI